VKSAFGYYAYRILSWLFGLLPEPAVRRIGYAAGYAFSLYPGAKLRMAERHQRRVLGPRGNARKSARRAFAFYGRYWAETFWMQPRRHAAVLSRTHIENIDRLHTAVESGRGVILALPHLGNWEAAGLRAAAEGARVLAVAEELGNERIVEWFIELRNMLDIDIVLARKGVTRELLKRLRSGGVVALVCDRDLAGSGVEVDFFGEKTTLPAGPAALADRTGAVLLPVATYFATGRGHEFTVCPPLEIPEGETAEDRTALGTQALAHALEDLIRRAPEQWHLLQPNWPSDREERP